MVKKLMLFYRYIFLNSKYTYIYNFFLEYDKIKVNKYSYYCLKIFQNKIDTGINI